MLVACNRTHVLRGMLAGFKRSVRTLLQTKMPPERRRALRAMSHAQYLRTPEWAMIKAIAELRDGHRCRICGRAGPLQGHHWRYPKSQRWDLDDPGNVTTLCAPCHAHNEARSREERYKGRKVEAVAYQPPAVLGRNSHEPPAIEVIPYTPRGAVGRNKLESEIIAVEPGDFRRIR
jgi:hypothetical protein